MGPKTRIMDWINLLFCLLCCCHGYHYGPPATEHVCKEMFPEGHHVDAQLDNDPPFEIDISQNVYTPWEVVQVTLRATKGYYFRGFFMQARRANCSHPKKFESLGTFQINPKDAHLLQTMTCLNHRDSAISHRINASFDKAVFHWNAPAAKLGHLYFRATVVKEQDIFWTNVQSTIMRDLSQEHDLAEYCPARQKIDPYETNTTPRAPTTARPPQPSSEKAKSCAVSQYTTWFLVSALLTLFVLTI